MCELMFWVCQMAIADSNRLCINAIDLCSCCIPHPLMCCPTYTVCGVCFCVRTAFSLFCVNLSAQNMCAHMLHSHYMCYIVNVYVIYAICYIRCLRLLQSLLASLSSVIRGLRRTCFPSLRFPFCANVYHCSSQYFQMSLLVFSCFSVVSLLLSCTRVGTHGLVVISVIECYHLPRKRCLIPELR